MALLKDLTVYGASRFIGDVLAAQVYGDGFHHNAHNNDDSVLLAGGGYKSINSLLGSGFWANQSVQTLSSTSTTPQFGKVMINTTSTSYQLNVSGDSYVTGWSRAGSGFYVHDQGVHYTYQQNGMPLIYETSNEFNFGIGSGNTLYFNYRSSRLGNTATEYRWHAGGSSYWATHYMGLAYHYLNGSTTYYLRIGPQNSSHAHYETNATVSHYFNKTIDVNGKIRIYGTNYCLNNEDGMFYGEGFKKSGSSNAYVLLGGGDHALLSNLSVANARYIETVTKNNGPEHYLTFVDSDNQSPSYESVYTNYDLRYHPKQRRLYIHKLDVDSEIFINGTARFYTDVKIEGSLEVNGTMRHYGPLYQNEDIYMDSHDIHDVEDIRGYGYIHMYGAEFNRLHVNGSSMFDGHVDMCGYSIGRVLDINGYGNIHMDGNGHFNNLQIDNRTHLWGELYVERTAHFYGNISARDIYPEYNNTYDLGTPNRYWKELFVGSDGNDCGGHIWWGRHYGDGKEFRFEDDGLIIYQDADDTSGIQLTGDVIRMWCPPDDNCIEFYNEDSGEKIWYINSDGWFSGYVSWDNIWNKPGQVGSPSVPIYWTGSAFNTCIVSFGNSSYGQHNANSITDNGIKYYNSNGPSGIGETTTDGALYSQAYNSSWVGQIAQDYRNGGLYVRGRNNGSWTTWQTVADSRNWKAKFGTTGSTSYIKININSYTSWMLSFVVRVYQGYTHYDIVFQGYNYGSNHWYSPVATLRSSSTTSTTVYFGYDSDWHLWVGIPGSSYTGVEIIECCNGYTQTNLMPGNLFTISNVSSLGGTTQSTQTIYRPWYRNETVSNTTYASYSTTIRTVESSTNAKFYFTFVDSNNTPNADYEYVYTNGELFYNPSIGAFGHGYQVTASGTNSHAEGYKTQATGYDSHAEGSQTIASGDYSHAEGDQAQAQGDHSHAEGKLSISYGTHSHAEGESTEARGGHSHTEGKLTIASGANSHAEGYGSQATGLRSHAEGSDTLAQGHQSHAESWETKAYGAGSHAEGYKTVAGQSGYNTLGDEGHCSHAEGEETVASGSNSHTEGYHSVASGRYSHAENYYTKATGWYSHAQGSYTEANGQYSFASGYYTVADNENEVAFGKYNKSNSDTIFSIGGGSSSSRYNLFEVTNGGVLKVRNSAYLCTNSGSVGIGTTTPGAKLHVNGDGLITGSLTVGTTSLYSYKLYVDGTGYFTGQLHAKVAQGTAPLAVTSTTLVSNLNADLLDGYHANGLFTVFGNSGNNITATIGGVPKTFTVNYASSAGYATYLPTKYDGGDKPNPQQYFNQNIGVRVAMTRYASIGGSTSWADTLWINGYSGNDVPNMCALTFKRDGTPRFFVHSQSNRATSYGTYYEVITGYNIGSQSVNYASNADKVDDYHAGVQNGQVSIFVPWPSIATMQSEGLLTSDYGTSGYGHPDEVYLQAICKWAIAHYVNLGDVTLIGSIAPNSSGTVIMHLYSSSGKDSTTLLPRYCASTYQTLSGPIYEFGCSNYTWYYRRLSAGNADTVDNQHFNYSNSSNSPTYLWGTNSSGTNFLARRDSLSVYYASNAANSTSSEYLNHYSVSNPADAKQDQMVKWFAQISSSSGYAGNNYGFPVSNNANGILWLGTHSGNYGGQIGISSNSSLYYRYISAGSFPTTANGGSWVRILTSGNSSVSGGGSSWGSSITVTINGTTKTLTIPAQPASSTDTKVTQNSNSDDSEYNILFKYTADNNNETNTVKYCSGLRVNPRHKKLFVDGEMDVDGTAHFNNDLKCHSSFTADGTGRFNTELYVSGTSHLTSVVTSDIYPSSTNYYELGKSDYRWKKIFVGTADSYGSSTNPIYWNGGVPTACTPYSNASVLYSTSSGKAGYIEGELLKEADLSDVSTVLPKFRLVKIGDFSCNHYGCIHINLYGNCLLDDLYVNYGSGDSREPMIFGWSSSNSQNVFSLDIKCADTWDGTWSLYIRFNQSPTVDNTHSGIKVYKMWGTGFTVNQTNNGWGEDAQLIGDGSFVSQFTAGTKTLSFPIKLGGFGNITGQSSSLGGLEQITNLNTGASKLYRNGSQGGSELMTGNVQNGFYWHDNNVTGKPCSSHGNLLTFSNKDNPIPGTDQHWIQQLDFTHDNKIWHRQKINTGDWTAWEQILTSANWSSYISVSGGGSGSISHQRVNDTTNRYVLGTTLTTNTTLSTVYSVSQFYFTKNGAYHTSDARKKYDIRDILNEDVTKLFETENAFIRHFKWISGNNDSYGFIAQELQEYCPEAVDFNTDGNYYAVNYNVAFSKIIGAMFKKIKELENKLKENGIS